MRAISIASGLAPDAIRNISRGAASAPRDKTVFKLAAVFGVDEGVIRGTDPLPDQGEAPPSKEAAKPSMPARRRPFTSPKPPVNGAPTATIGHRIAAVVREYATGNPDRILIQVVSAAAVALAEAGMSSTRAISAIDAVAAVLEE